MPRRALLCALALCLGSLVVPVRPAAAEPPPTYIAPVDAPVVDGFRPPVGPYGAGNRGLEYGTAPGSEVHAAADGVVTFAGLVAGTRHVTILHADGLRTSYSFLSRTDVVVGQRVRQGDVLGATIEHLHLGARSGDAYLDPASLFQGEQLPVHLVPFDEPPGDGPDSERSAISQLIGGLRGALGDRANDAVDHALKGTGATADWLRHNGPQLLRTAGHYMRRAAPGGAQLQALLDGMRAWGLAQAAADRPCTAADTVVPLPPIERRVAVLVGGLGSSSVAAAIDDVRTASLGYDNADVIRFSYAGGRTPDATDGFSTVEATTYAAPDTQVDLRTSGARLADLIEEVVAATPSLPVDLYAHSQGGLVARLALIELDRRHEEAWLDHLGLVATLATPHGGSDLATAAYGVGSTKVGSAAIDRLLAASQAELDDDAPAIAQLAETSDLVAELAGVPLPAGVDAVSIAARGDVVVPLPRTAVAGAPQVVVPLSGPGAHAALPGSPEANRELALALSGRPPTCTSFRAALSDQLTGLGISWAEDTAGSLGWLGAARAGPPLGG